MIAKLGESRLWWVKRKLVVRPVNKVYLLKLIEENEEVHKENEQRDRPGRQTAIIADLKQKFVK